MKLTLNFTSIKDKLPQYNKWVFIYKPSRQGKRYDIGRLSETKHFGDVFRTDSGYVYYLNEETDVYWEYLPKTIE